MTEMHLRQPGFMYSARGPFTKNKERIKKFKEIGDSRHFYQNQLDKSCFQHDMAYGDFKDLNRITAANTFLRDNLFHIARNPKYDGYQHGLASMLYKIFDKITSGSSTEEGNISNKEQAEELHAPIIKKIIERKVHSPFLEILGVQI